MLRHLASLVLSTAALAGCSPFLADRGHDLAQIVDVSAGYSEGFAVNLRATKLIQIGLGGYRGIWWTGLKNGALDLWMEERAELGIGPLYMHEVFRSRGCRLLDIRHPLFGDPGYRELSWDLSHLTDRGWLDVGATVNLVLVGFDVALKPAELADFMIGWVGQDLLLDDGEAPSDDELLRRLRGEGARVRASAARALQRRFGERYGYEIYSAPNYMTDEQARAIRFWRERVGGPFDAPSKPEAELPEPPPEPALPKPEPYQPPSTTDGAPDATGG